MRQRGYGSVGYGKGQGTCNACDLPVKPGEVEYEANLPGRHTLRFHQGCLAAWHKERAAYLKP